jgi:hypothetical protein
MPALTPPKQLTFSCSVLLAVAAVLVRFAAYTGAPMPSYFPTQGFLLLLVVYLVLVAGILFKGA